MKKILTTVVVSLIVLIGGLSITSCAMHKNADGSTSIRLTPAAHKTISDVGKAGVDILSILSMFIPTLAPITAAAGAGVVTWNRMGKKVTKYKTPLEHTVDVLEAVKKDPKLWEQIKPFFKGMSKDGLFGQPPSAKTEATIRELIDNGKGAV